MIKKILIFTIACSLGGQQLSVVTVPFSRATKILRVLTQENGKDLVATKTNVDLDEPGKRQRGEVLVVRDPVSGRFLWHYAALSPSAAQSSYLDAIEAGLIVIYAEPAILLEVDSSSGLFIVRHDDQAPSDEAAELTAIRFLKEGHPTLNRYGWTREAGQRPTDPRVPVSPPGLIPIYSSIGREFYCEPMSAICPTTAPKVTSIEHKGGQWRFVLTARWEQEVIIDETLTRLISTRQIGPLKRR